MSKIMLVSRIDEDGEAVEYEVDVRPFPKPLTWILLLIMSVQVFFMSTTQEKFESYVFFVQDSASKISEAVTIWR
jgi:hypothetical protein